MGRIIPSIPHQVGEGVLSAFYEGPEVATFGVVVDTIIIRGLNTFSFALVSTTVYDLGLSPIYGPHVLYQVYILGGYLRHIRGRETTSYYDER